MSWVYQRPQPQRPYPPFGNQCRMTDIPIKLLFLWTVVWIPFGISPPVRERMWRASSAKDGKRQDEDTKQTSSIQSSRDEVRIVLEDPRSIISKVVLNEQA
jgi:hypothetical protein